MDSNLVELLTGLVTLLVSIVTIGGAYLANQNQQLQTRVNHLEQKQELLENRLDEAEQQAEMERLVNERVLLAYQGLWIHAMDMVASFVELLSTSGHSVPESVNALRSHPACEDVRETARMQVSAELERRRQQQ